MGLSYCFVDTTKGLHQAAQQLAQADTFYIDTEFELGSGNGGKLCLIQISAGEQIYLIDALRLSAMDPFIDAITGDDVQWVLHSGKKDLELLRDKFHLDRLPAIFDTQAAWGLLNAECTISLAYLNYTVLGRRTPKEHQASPWNTRPLPEPQLHYAASDVQTLPLLYTALGEMLERQSKRDLVHEVSRELCLPPEPEKTPPVQMPVSLADFRNAWELDYGSQAALQFLIDWWNTSPAQMRPAGMKPYILFQIARRMPESGQELARIKGVPARWARQYGDTLTGRLIRASYEAQESQFPPIEPQPYVTFEEIQLEAFLAAMKYAVSRMAGIAPEVSFPHWVMHGLKLRLLNNPDVRAAVVELQGWRQKWLAGPYLDFCKRWEPFDRGIAMLAAESLTGEGGGSDAFGHDGFADGTSAGQGTTDGVLADAELDDDALSDHVLGGTLEADNGSQLRAGR